MAHLTYEEFIQLIQDISDNTSNKFYITKEEYENMIKSFDIIEEQHNKIENLAENYFNPNRENNLPKEYFKRIAYYDIIEYCFKKIKEDDEILKKNLGFSGFVKEEK